MTTFSELQRTLNLNNLPRIEQNHFQLLWHCDYWDGVKSGVLLYQDREFWFQVFSESDTADYYRRFAVLELSESQLQEEEYWHKLFQEKVGTHTDYDENSKRAVGALKPRDMWSEFYDAYQNRESPDFSNNIVVGWFEI